MSLILFTVKCIKTSDVDVGPLLVVILKVSKVFCLRTFLMWSKLSLYVTLKFLCVPLVTKICESDAQLIGNMPLMITVMCEFAAGQCDFC